MSTVAFIRRCMAAGMDLDTALVAAEAFEQSTPTYVPAQSAGAQRTAKWRAKKASQTVTVTHGDAGDDRDAETSPETPPSRTQVVIPSLPSLRSEEVGVVGGETREPDPKPDDWPKGNGPHLAKLLVDAVGSHWLDPNRSPDLTLTAGRLAAWKRDGASWEHDVVPVVRALCAKRRSRIGSWKYFDDAMARSIADNRAALEIPEAGTVRATGPPSFADREAADRAEARRRVLES